MTDRPILFSPAMIQALLAGRKTQTRRLVKPQPEFLQVYEHKGRVVHDSSLRSWCWGGEAHGRYPDEWGPSLAAACPHGRPGDLLVVRETFRLAGEFDDVKPTLARPNTPVWYEATTDRTRPEGWGKTRVSIHMPRWASRLTLELTEVRVERLNDCTEADALAEGVVHDEKRGFIVPGIEHPNQDFPYLARATAREMYAALWDVINGSGEWLANPFVWALTFKVHRLNIDAFKENRT